MSLVVPDFSAGTVLTVGDLMLDQYWFGPTTRISPEAPVPVVNVTGAQTRAGGAANVAVNLASLGAQVTMVQRSPPYVVSRSDEDKIANFLRKCLPADWAYKLTRLKNTVLINF